MHIFDRAMFQYSGFVWLHNCVSAHFRKNPTPASLGKYTV